VNLSLTRVPRCVSQAGWIKKFAAEKKAVPHPNKMFLTAIDAAMAAVQDARGEISPKLAQSKKPSLQVLESEQSLAEAEPVTGSVVPAEAAAEPEVEPQAQAQAEPTGEAAMPEAMPETPPLSPQMFPADAGPMGAVMAKGMDEQPMSTNAVTVQPKPAQIEETMMPQPGMVQAPGVDAQVLSYSYPVYPGAQVQVAVKHASAVPAPAPAPAPTGDICTVGQRQSPINIELNVESAELPVLAWRLTTPGVFTGLFAPVQEEGQGKWLRVVDAGLAMSVKGVDYALRSLLTHSPSEHTVSGQRFDMEVQFLHSATVGEQQQYLMVSVMVNRADAGAPAIADLAGKMEEMETAAEISVNIRDLAMEVLAQTELVSPTATNAENYFVYDGSFTTAPCTEAVTWVVLKNPLQASAVDIETLAAALPQTNRPLQAIGTRVVQDRHVLG